MNKLQVAVGDLLKYIAARCGVSANVSHMIVAVRKETAQDVPVQLLATLARPYPSPTRSMWTRFISPVASVRLVREDEHSLLLRNVRVAISN
jgi:hypothetical protein